LKARRVGALLVRVSGGITGTELCMGHKTLLVVRWAKHVHGWKAKTDDLGAFVFTALQAAANGIN